ncbi:alpha/beta hydrolase [Octadecabacter sp. 1_MG-2023]|uniref:alpha/beta hydrolase n=1 Tax=unclassified Octadecabacter TaxID=196158 RepID=UPI001C09D20D|nr:MULTISPECIES: alpha/beta hydrolase [unclassified Octadecabacter]MBU2994360.1 alpha/beta fold hydrolase [Octadecabacter sp. B2R22]MDO6734351.1 alpha/beta hydrolase [Octadecabacter sp. 1_MG-2023]
MTNRDAADQAYANSAYIPDGESYYERWDAAAEAFRAAHADKELGVAYGEGGGQTYDMFHPAQASRGTVIFLHGGYWMAGSPRMFSHLAAGAVAAGYACAMPAYTLAPQARLAQMADEVEAAIAEIAKRTDGPLYLVGHSAGGQLVARMGCADKKAPWSTRVQRVMAISLLSDLEPLRETTMNDTLGIDEGEALDESPIRHRPQNIPMTAWVGGNERPAFLDQAMGLADAWDCDLTIEAGKHHFDVIEGLENPISPMMRALFRA